MREEGLAEWRFLRNFLKSNEIKKLNVRVTDLGIACGRSHLGRFGGADPRVRAGPPGPALRPKDQKFASVLQADEGVGRGPGVRPTVHTRDATAAWRIGGLRYTSGGFDHRGCKSLIRRGLGEFLYGTV